MQIICSSLQTGNHESSSSLNYLLAGCSSCGPSNNVKALKAVIDFTLSYEAVAKVMNFIHFCPNVGIVKHCKNMSHYDPVFVRKFQIGHFQCMPMIRRLVNFADFYQRNTY